VRELKNVLAYALAFVEEGGALEARHLRFVPGAAAGTVLERLPLGGHLLERVEEATIRQTLALTKGNKAHAARLLGISASTLYDKLKRYDDD
jgi:transcriptional regulator of acetoin/glycerol metabolism